PCSPSCPENFLKTGAGLRAEWRWSCRLTKNASEIGRPVLSLPVRIRNSGAAEDVAEQWSDLRFPAGHEFSCAQLSNKVKVSADEPAAGKCHDRPPRDALAFVWRIVDIVMQEGIADGYLPQPVPQCNIRVSPYHYG